MQAEEVLKEQEQEQKKAECEKKLLNGMEKEWGKMQQPAMKLEKNMEEMCSCYLRRMIMSKYPNFIVSLCLWNNNLIIVCDKLSHKDIS